MILESIQGRQEQQDAVGLAGTQRALSRHMARVERKKMGINRKDPNRFGGPLGEFFATKVPAADKKRFDHLFSSLETFGPMNSTCRAVVTIPAKYSEQGLGTTLEQYAGQQAAGTNFEVIVLVNGPESIDLLSSKAYLDAKRVQEEHPELRLSIARYNYNSSDRQVKIGMIRRDLAAIALKRAEHANVDLANLIILSRDADPKSISPTSVAAIVKEFDRCDGNESLAALGGFVDYTDSSFARNHFLFAYKRFLDLLEIVDRHSTDTVYFQTLNDQNAAFRASDYIATGGHPPARVAESNRIVQRLVEAGRNVGYRRGKDFNVITSDRRVVSTLNRHTFNDQYRDFGTPDDNDVYRDPTALTDPEQYLISSPSFQSLVEQTFTTIYSEKVRRTPDRVITVQQRAARAAKIMGIDIEFTDKGLVITDMNRFNEYVERKFMRD